MPNILNSPKHSEFAAPQFPSNSAEEYFYRISHLQSFLQVTACFFKRRCYIYSIYNDTRRRLEHFQDGSFCGIRSVSAPGRHGKVRSLIPLFRNRPHGVFPIPPPPFTETNCGPDLVRERFLAAASEPESNREALCRKKK